MRCENCGSPIEPNDVYCGNCGHRIEREEIIDNKDDDIQIIDVNANDEFDEPKNNSSNQSSGSAQNSGTNFSSNKYTNPFDQNMYNNSSKNYSNNGNIKVKMSNSSAVVSLVCGILSLVMLSTIVVSFILALVGLSSAKKAKALIATGEYDGESYVKAGTICSKIGLVLSIICGVFYILIFMFTFIVSLLQVSG